MKFYVFCLLFAFVQINSARILPDFVPSCKRSDPELSNCLKNAVEKVRPHLAKGIPKINAPALEPLVIPKLEIDRKLDNAVIKASLKDIKVMGANGFVVDNIIIDLDKNEGKIEIMLPKLQVTCGYDVAGRILAVDLNSKGKMTGEFLNTKVNVEVGLKSVDKNGVSHLEISSIKSKVHVDGGAINLADSNKNNQAAADNVVTFFNKNTRQALESVAPIIDDTAAEVIKTIMNQIFTAVPTDELLPK